MFIQNDVRPCILSFFSGDIRFNGMVAFRSFETDRSDDRKNGPTPEKWLITADADGFRESLNPTISVQEIPISIRMTHRY